MVAQFDSKCFVCQQTVKAGSDVYYKKGQGVAHWSCLEEQDTSAESVELAERLGFRCHANAMGADRDLL